MKRLKAFRYRAYPTPEQIAQADGWNDPLRWLWNIALEQRLIGLARPKGERKYPSLERQRKELTELLKLRAKPKSKSKGNGQEQAYSAYEIATASWLSAVPRNVLDSVLIALDEAWQRCFAGLAKQPRFKKKGRDVLNLHEFSPLCFHLDDHAGREPRSKRDDRRNAGYLHFPKIKGAIRVVAHRPLEGKPKTCSLVRDGGQWFAAITCETTSPEADAPCVGPAVAIDRGIAQLAALSDGTFVENQRFFDKAQPKIRKLQKSLSRKQKGSRNWHAAKERLNRACRDVRNRRNHYLHEQSSILAKSHGVVIVERLHIASMMKVGGGLARSIADAAWGTLVRFTEYKLDWNGGTLDDVWCQYSSQECEMCEHVNAASRRSQSLFVCTKCGHTANADTNAAKVLLKRWTKTQTERSMALASSRVNTSGLPVDGQPLEGSRRSRKAEAKKTLRKVRRPSLPELLQKPPPLGGG